MDWRGDAAQDRGVRRSGRHHSPRAEDPTNPTRDEFGATLARVTEYQTMFDTH